MKTLISLFLTSVLLTSCAGTYQEIGSLSMLSDRKVDPTGRYQRLAEAAGSSKKQIKKTAALNIEDAIDQVLDAVPGGKYITNVKIYVVHGEYIAVSGDVWGQPTTTASGKSDGNITLKASSINSHDINKVAGTINSFDKGIESIAK
jgi:hypothetical protein